MNNGCRNIVLIGMPGCGKTTIGRLLAGRLGRKFIDIDRLIEEQAGCTINELFKQGEEHFRDLEAVTVFALEKEKASVISAGGGVVKRASNIESLKKNGMIIFIDRSLEDIAADIDASTRPLLAKGKDKLTELYSERYELYRKYSDFVVLNKGEIMEVVENILRII